MTQPSVNYTAMAYLTKQRWNSYWYQLHEVTRLVHVKTILEVGIGNTIVTSVLRQMGYDVKTVDMNPQTHPDYVADIRSLADVMRTPADVILCCQTLEHILYEDVPQVLRDFYKISNEHLIVTLPYSTLGTYKPRLLIKLIPFIKEFRWIGCFNLFPKRHPDSRPGGHFWEIGKRGHRLKNVLALFPANGWNIVKHYPLFENPFHYMIVCRKRV